MKTELFEQYASIKSEIKTLQQMEETLKRQVLSELEEAKADKAEFVFGKFTVANKKNWKYSNKVNKMEEDLKLLKYKEQEQGVAEADITNYIIFTPNEVKE